MKTNYQFILLISMLYFLFSNSMVAVNPPPINDLNKNVTEVEKSKTQLKIETKFDRKSKRLQKKIAKITEDPKESKKGRIIFIIGAVFLIIGLIVLGSALAGPSTIAGCLEVLFGLIFGISFGIGGIVMMIIGLVQGI